MRFQELMPDPLHWLGVRRIDKFISMSDMKYDAVTGSGIEIIEREEAANQHALELARGGDLVLVLADNVTRSWKQIIYFQPGDDVVSDAPERGAVDIPEEFFGDFSLDEDLELIRDERGVRIARESDD